MKMDRAEIDRRIAEIRERETEPHGGYIADDLRAELYRDVLRAMAETPKDWLNGGASCEIARHALQAEEASQ